jgi:hypothetical protein
MEVDGCKEGEEVSKKVHTVFCWCEVAWRMRLCADQFTSMSEGRGRYFKWS